MHSYSKYLEVSKVESYLIMYLNSLVFHRDINKKIIYLHILQLKLLDIVNSIFKLEINNFYRIDSNELIKIKKNFHKEKNILVDKINNEKIKINNDDYLADIISNWEENLKNYFIDIINEDNTLYKIISVIHMLNNRVLGIDTIKEKEIMVILNVLYYYFKYKK